MSQGCSSAPSPAFPDADGQRFLTLTASVRQSADATGASESSIVTAVEPWMTLDRAPLSDGGEMVLSRSGDEFAIRVDGMDLMNGWSHGSEEKLAEYGCAGLRDKPGARVLVGGLGIGFTARAALDALGADAHVDVVELMGAVIAWNRNIFGHLAGAPLDDPRLHVIEADIVDTIAQTTEPYDAVLLDVDNGPKAFTLAGNKRLYSLEGLAAITRSIRPGGMLGLWSAHADSRFSARLGEAGFAFETRRVRAGGYAGRRHVLWLARTPVV
jgi:predicted membrane-bound spermidine synthase